MCRDDLSGNCKWWSTADIIKQLQQAQAQDVSKMTESSVTKHLLDGHFVSIWPQSWLRNWPRNNVVHARNAQLVTPTSREKVYSWLKMVWVNSSRASREEGNKSIDGTHRLCVRWNCHEKISITWKHSLKSFFPEFWQKVERGRVLEL